MRIGIHQPNFVPHFGFFHKMSMCDAFIILEQVQYEKNGYQNRYFLQGKQKWITMPIKHGVDQIFNKYYTNGESLVQLNTEFILWVMRVLSIKTVLWKDVVTDSRSTQRLLDNLNHYGATHYVTSPGAKDKYLDEDLIKKAGIDIIYSKHPNDKMNILEMFETFGIEGTRKQLYQKPDAAVQGPPCTEKPSTNEEGS